nr:hypothetical protein [Okeania sp. KiyG1]
MVLMALEDLRVRMPFLTIALIPPLEVGQDGRIQIPLTLQHQVS